MKRFQYRIDNKLCLIEAEPEGEGRYMVRMTIGATHNVRIGYLTGAKRKWTAEFLGGRQSEAFGTAVAACEYMAKWAITQPAFWL